MYEKINKKQNQKVDKICEEVDNEVYLVKIIKVFC